jgi:sugar/nucleoside kinase (ribokinase family)
VNEGSGPLTKKFDVSVIGELNLDLILSGLPAKLTLEREHLAEHLSITLGSSSAIFAHNLSSLGSTVGFSSSIGEDPLGEICLQRLGASGVDLGGVRRMRGKTTGLTVILPQGKQRYILTYPGTMFEMSEKDLNMAYALSAKHLHVSSYFLQKNMQASLPDIFRKAKVAGLTTSMDTNDDPEGTWDAGIHNVLPHVDVLLPNEREACKLAGVEDAQRAAELLCRIVKIVVIKRGSKGALARVSGKETVAMPPSVEVADHVGAGDSFDAGFIHEFIRGATIQDSLAYGNITAALSVTRPGGTEAFRDEAYREAFLRDHQRKPELRAQR